MVDLFCRVSPEALDMAFKARIGTALELVAGLEISSHYPAPGVLLAGSDRFNSGGPHWEPALPLFCGQPIQLDQDRLVAELARDNWSVLQELDGYWLMVYWDAPRQRLIVASDRRSQQMSYVRELPGGGVDIASRLHPLMMTGISNTFNPDWLTEVLAFNLPLSTATPLAGAERLEAAEVRIYDRAGRLEHKSRWAEFFQSPSTLLSGKESFEAVLQTFRMAIPQYGDSVPRKACSLTCGWDGRTVLAFSDRERTLPFTYGLPGAIDIEVGTSISRKVGRDHLVIPFEDTFINQMPAWCHATALLG